MSQIHLEPRTQQPGQRCAVILLHGFGSNEEDLIGLAPLLPPSLEVFSLRAPVALGPGSFAWYRLDWSSGRPDADPQEIAVAEQALHARIAALLHEHGLPRRDVFLLGFSQGSIMSLAEAYTSPESYKGVAVLSGRLPLSLPKSFHQLSKMTPAFVAHGESDPVLFHEDGVQVAKTLTELGVKTAFHSYPMAHQVCEQEMQDLRNWMNLLLNENRTDEPSSSAL